MLRIGMVGTFDVANFGDRLFPLIARRELERRLGPIDMRPFSYHARSTPSWPFAVTPLEQLGAALPSLDLLIVGGGDIIRFDPLVALDYRPQSRRLHHPTGFWLPPILMAHVAGVPVAWNAPGVPAPIPHWAAPLVRAGLAVSAYISVRDGSSRTFLASVLPGVAVDVVPDSAFDAATLLAGASDGRVKPPVRHLPAAIAHGSYLVVQNRPEATSWLPHLRRLLAESHPRFVLTPIGPAIGDRVSPPDRLPPDTTFCPAMDPCDLLALVAASAGVVGTSLHLTIAALATGRSAFRPKTAALRKYGVLEALQGIQTFEPGARPERPAPARAPDPAQLAGMRPQLSRHWDHIAALARSRAAVPPEARNWQPLLMDLWQTLPSLLEHRSPIEKVADVMRNARARLARYR